MTREQCICLAAICVFEKRDDFSDSTLMDVLSFLTDAWRDEQERKDATPFGDNLPPLSREYTVADIAQAVGLYTVSGSSAHGPAVNAIISHLELEPGEQTNGAVNWAKKRYKASVVWKVSNWLAEHGLPTTIVSASGQEYKVTYSADSVPGEEEEAT